jgi:Domain of Unknown Function with PDB structure (DUF3857)/Transglutaminase-like superfamily
MRIRVCGFAGVTLAALALAFTASAQKFQEPTKEELQMTSDPKAPGAPAVYLDREFNVDNGNFVTTEHARIKILTEEGKQWSTIEFPYDPRFHDVPEIEARTIHADGAVATLIGDPIHFVTFRDRRDPSEIHDPKQVAVFTVPGAEVGSIVEYRWSLRILGKIPVTAKERESASLHSGGFSFSIPRWDLQRDLFVHKEHFYLNPYSNRLVVNGGPRFSDFRYGQVAKYFLVASRLPAGAQVQEGPKSDYALDLTDVPALQREPNSLAARARAYRVQFYFSPYFTAADYWPNVLKWWTGFVKERVEGSRVIRDAAAQIVSGADTPDVKAQKLYEAVEALDNTDFAKPKPGASRLDEPMPGAILKYAEEVWKDKSGTAADLVILYVALARAAGIDATDMRVVDRSRGAFDPNYLDLAQFDEQIVHLRLDGKDLYLDPGEKLCPFGQLKWSHTVTAGADEGGKEPTFTPPNSSKDAVTAHAADLTLDARGAFTGTVKILMNGPEALQWRQLNLTVDPDEFKKQFSEMLHSLLPTGTSEEMAGFQGMDSSAGYLSAQVRVSGQLGITSGKRMLLPGFFFSVNSPLQLVPDEKRETAIDMHYAKQVIDDTVYHLPAGFAVESAPQPAQLPWPDHAALVVKTAPGAGVIDIKHIFARAFILLDAKEYPALLDYYQKIAVNDQQQLVLVASGN